MAYRELITDLSAGQVDQRLAARVDADVYQNGLLTALNWMPLSQGGIKTRPGFTSLATVMPTAEYGTQFRRIVHWSFDEDEKYIFVFSQTEMAIYSVESNGTLASRQRHDLRDDWVIATLQELKELSIASLGDRTIVGHRNLRPLMITRTGLHTFQVVKFSFGTWIGGFQSQEPTWKIASKDITMGYCDVNGVPVVEVPEGLECWVQWFGKDPYTNLYYDPSHIAVNSILRHSNRPMQVLAAADANGRVYVKTLRKLPITYRIKVNYSRDSGQILDRGMEWVDYETVICEQTSGEGIITSRTKIGTDFYIDVIVLEGSFFDGDLVIVGAESKMVCYTPTTGFAAYGVPNEPTPFWEESLFSDYRGWFDAVTFFQQRLWLGGSWDAPQVLVASRIREYTNFDVGQGQDADSIQVMISAQGAGQIRKLSPARHLVIFTESSEHYIGESEQEVISPQTVSIRNAGRFGIGQSSPRAFGGNIFLVDRSNRQIRTFGWNDVSQAYNAVPMTYAHEDLFQAIREVEVMYAFEGSPAEYYFVLDDNGTLVLVFAIPQAKVMGFWPWDFQFPMQSISTDGQRLYMLSENVIYYANPNTICERVSKLRTMQARVKAQEGEMRGHWIKQVKVELEGTLAQFTLNGRTVNPALKTHPDDKLPQRYEIWLGNWSRKPDINLEIPAGIGGTILSLTQEVGL